MKNAVVVPITSVVYNSETFRKFSLSITNATRGLPSTIDGESHDHIFLLEDVTTYTARIGRTGYTKAVHPGAINFTGATTTTRKRARVLASASSSSPTSSPRSSWSWRTRSQGWTRLSRGVFLKQSRNARLP